MLDRVRIVLVRPIRPGNVGAVSRAMMNMGLSDLCIVSPQCDPADPAAVGFAARAQPLLERARVVESLGEALDGCVQTYAATGKGGLYRKQAATTPAEAAREALRVSAPGRAAFAFGPEDNGLVLSELLAFDHVVEIPADPAYPVLNLAAAVMIQCYELRRMAAEIEPLAPAGQDDPPARDEQKRILYERLFGALHRVGFFSRQQTSDHLRFALRRVFGRAALSAHEVDVLIGMASQIHWYVDQRESGNDVRF